MNSRNGRYLASVIQVRISLSERIKAQPDPTPLLLFLAVKIFDLCQVPSPTPEMDNVIFEDPSKRHPRLKRPSQVQPIEVTPNQNDPARREQQRCVPSQRLGASDLDLGVSGRSSGESGIRLLLSPQAGLCRSLTKKQKPLPTVSMAIKAARSTALPTGRISTLLVSRHLLCSNSFRCPKMIATLSTRVVLVSRIVCFHLPSQKAPRWTLTRVFPLPLTSVARPQLRTWTVTIG
jgi:hypothetical protein